MREVLWARREVSEVRDAVTVGVDIDLVDRLVREWVCSRGLAWLYAERRMDVHDQDRLSIVARFDECKDVGEVEAGVAVREPKRRPE